MGNTKSQRAEQKELPPVRHEGNRRKNRGQLQKVAETLEQGPINDLISPGPQPSFVAPGGSPQLVADRRMTRPPKPSPRTGSEHRLEQHLRNELQKLGFRVIKLNPDWAIGIPDRLVLTPMGKVIFVELKTKSNVSKAQRRWYDWLKTNGFDARIVRGPDEADEFLKEMYREATARPTRK